MYLASKLTVALGCACLVASCVFACSPTTTGGLPQAAPAAQLASGEKIYEQTCATSSCHGARGEGIRAGSGFSVWPLVGVEFQRRHPNAQVVFDVVRSGDEPSLRALTDQQIYDTVAFDLSQNHIPLQAPLTAATASQTYGAGMSGNASDGLFPPFGDFEQAVPIPHASLPLSGDAGGLRLQVDQLGEVRSVGGAPPPAGRLYLVLVIELVDTGSAPMDVGPENLQMRTLSGSLLSPPSIDVHAAIEKFHDQTIQPQHGTSALALFSFPAQDPFAQLVYSDKYGHRLVLNLGP
jgi:mono/diheme cytochrome c family protein